MSIFYHYQPRMPRTIDTLQIGDCFEIILNDLARYGVPENLAMKLINTHFIRLNRAANELKKTYSEVTLKNKPDSAFYKKNPTDK